MDNVEKLHALTAAQQGLLYQTLLGEHDAVYRTQSRFDVIGDLDLGVFRAALDFLVQRHGMLRTMFLHVGLDEPAAVVQQSVELPWFEHDLQGMEDSVQQERLNELAAQSLEKPFNLDEAPLLRISVARQNDRLTHVIFDIHHLIFDGWSSVLFFTELQTTYGALVAGSEPSLPSAGDYAEHVASVNSQSNSQSSAIWAKKLAGFSLPTPLPLHNHPGIGQFATGNFSDQLEAEVTRNLERIAAESRTTVNTLVQAAWSLVLSRFSGNDDIVIGITVNGRSANIEQHTRTFGLFANTLPLRIQCDPDTRLDAWLSGIQKDLTSIVDMENSSLADVHKVSDVPVGVNLFDSLLVFQNFPELEHTAEPTLYVANARVHENSPLPLTIEVFHGTELGFLVMYIEEQFEPGAVQRVVDYFKVVLRGIASLDRVKGTVGNLPFLSEQEMSALVGPDVFSPAPTTEFKTLHGAFFSQVASQPDKTVLSKIDASGLEITRSYADIAARANLVTAYLLTQGVRPGQCVAFCMERGFDTYAVMMGIMDCGAHWLALDATYPQERLLFMLEDSGATIVFTDSTCPLEQQGDSITHVDLQASISDFQDALQARSVLFSKGSLSANGSMHSAPGDVAYLMYTSGSTGKPKGVLGTHKATLNRFAWMWKEFPFQIDDQCCQKTALSFVDSVWELLGPVLDSVPVHIISDEVVQNPIGFVEELRVKDITRLLVVPSLLEVLLDLHSNLGELLPKLKMLVSSGEPLPEATAAAIIQQFPNTVFLNLYGSTEVSADATFQRVDKESLATPMPVGKAVPGNAVYLLDQRLRPVPLGAQGQICIAGAGVARGYLNASVEDEQRFVDDPYSSGSLYKTGDLGRFDRDRALIHLGREDSQLKIRGRRVEAAEIQLALQEHPAVNQSVVAMQMDQILVAYIVADAASEKSDKSARNEAIQQFLEKKLPEYMVPRHYVDLEQVPLLPNGKTDYAQLPLPDELISNSQGVHLEPRTETEKKVAAAWQEILGGEPPSVMDNFVASGGTSLSGMRFNALLFREFDKMVMPRMLLSANLAQLALSLKPEDIPPESEAEVPTDRMEPLYFGSQDSRLFGMMHLPPPGTDQKKAVLICQSAGADYMRAHRCLQMTAVDLARKGFTVLRFDLFGVGDSYGTLAEASVEIWLQNIRQAASLVMERIENKEPTKELTVIAPRLSAALVASAELTSLEHLIVWDPEWTGAEFLRRQRSLHQRAMNDLDRYRFKQKNTSSDELFGYSYSENLVSQLQKLDPASNTTQSGIAGNLTVVQTGSDESSGSDSNMLQRMSARTNVMLVDELSVWADYHEAGSLMFATKVIQALTESVTN